MDIEAFRRHAHELVDWMADYLDGVENYPVRAQTRPGDVAGRLSDQAPRAGEPFERIFEDFKADVLPGITHWQHPSFFAYFPANASPPSVLGEMLTATLGVNCMLWQTSPAGTEMETKVLDWLRRAIGLPKDFVGVIQDTASSASLAAILTARERATDWRSNSDGLSDAGAMAVYCTAESHSSIEKDVGIAGIGRANVRKVPVDENFAMIPGALESAIADDIAKGIRPICVIATLGTTGVGAVDPLRPISEICRRNDVFLHVDAAWAGSALLLEPYRWMIDGIEDADSFVFNPHKWLMTNFDCSAHYVRDPAALVRTFSILPEYLKGAASGDVIDYRDWGVPLGRRFRALKLWFVLRAYGLDGLTRIIASHIELANELARRIKGTPDFEMMAPPSLALLNFRYRPQGLDDADAIDQLNERLLQILNDSGALYLTQNRINGAYAIRFSIGQTCTERRHVDEAWRLIQETARGLRAS